MTVTDEDASDDASDDEDEDDDEDDADDLTITAAWIGRLKQSVQMHAHEKACNKNTYKMRSEPWFR